jgi:PTH1 family peptidyl-tRNA hydrolase
METTLIIGLGNPDPALENTYHNVGALAVDLLAERAADGTAAPRFRPHGGLFSYMKTGNFILAKPLVFMNDSGRAVKDAMRVFDVKPERIVVIHDDSDIPVGEFKRAAGGGSAGHKGIRSIIENIRTEDFTRIRIGIREKDEVRRKKAGDFVLSPISADDEKIFAEVFERIADSLLGS